MRVDGGVHGFIWFAVHFFESVACGGGENWYDGQMNLRIVLGCVCVLAPVCDAGLKSELVADGFERPVWAGAPKGLSGKLWVMEQAGTVWVVDLKDGSKGEVPFLEMKDQVSRKGNEEGLLGLAFCPEFEESGRYYINFTDHDQMSHVVRYVTADRATTDVSKGEVILSYKQDFRNHNGGWLDFGPDGMLYVGTGDGGSGNDPKGRAQDPKSMLGKLLRIDVSGKEGYSIPADNPYVESSEFLPEIVSIGLRNPWRCSFDRETGDFWIGDVGQNAWEEINFVENGKLAKLNFGWRLREGDIETPAKGVGGKKPSNNHDPIYVYKHGAGPSEGKSVTGGHVYRGKAIPSMVGRYFFGDYQNPRIWSIVEKGGKADDFTDHTSELQPEGGRINLIASFAEDGDGELYVIDHTGPVYRVVGR